MDLTKYLSDNKFFKVLVKTNCSKTEIISFDEIKNVIKLNVNAQPTDGKANIEIIKFFSKKLKKKVEIKSGKTSKEKLIKILD